jgi:hypothetical protein
VACATLVIYEYCEHVASILTTTSFGSSDIVPVLQLDNEVGTSTGMGYILINRSDIGGTILGV